MLNLMMDNFQRETERDAEAADVLEEIEEPTESAPSKKPPPKPATPQCNVVPEETHSNASTLLYFGEMKNCPDAAEVPWGQRHRHSLP
mmetsp:Transcript_26254/g.55837  ORF Transcript_26254/g.55837 Transcript_26254/m.55837 type:complete len:88 (+) Transcript_26254:171-434(+)